MIRRRLWILAAWSAAFLLALAADRPIATWVHTSGIDIQLKSHWHPLLKSIRLAGNFWTFSLPASAILFLLGPRWYKPAALVLLSGFFSGSNQILKWIIGRRRPFQGEMFQPHLFAGGWHGLFGPNLSFPSGDVCLAAATASSLAILFPRYRWLLAMVVILVALERISEGAHFPSDTVAGAALGWAGTCLAWRLLGRPTLGEPA